MARRHSSRFPVLPWLTSLTRLPSGLVKRIASSTAFSLLDQASVSGANFVLNVLLARSLEPAAYGAFAFAFSIFLLAGTVHGALVSEPLLVLGNGRYRTRLGAYMRAVFKGNWIISGGLALLFLVAGPLVMSFGSHVGGALLAFGIATPLILFQWTARRACYTALQPRWAALSNVTYMVFVVGVALVVSRFGQFTPFTTILLMGAGSALSGLVAYRALLNVPGHDGHIGLAEIREHHWSFGKWLLGASALKWMKSNVAVIVLPAVLSMAAVGELKALTVVLLPIAHTLAALTPLFSPLLARSLESPRFGNLVLGLTAAVVFGTLAYYAMLAMFGTELLSLAYGGEKYVHLAPLLIVFGLAPVFGAVGQVLSSAVSAMLRTSGIFTASIVSAVVALSAAVLLVRPLGLLGGILVDVAASAAFAVALIPLYLNHRASVKRAAATAGAR